MPFRISPNNARSTLSVAISSNTQASLTLQTGDGAKFPAPSAPNYYTATVDDGTNIEIVLVVAVSGDVLTVLRGQDFTTAQSSFAIGSKVEKRITESDIRWRDYTVPMMKFHCKAAAGVTSWHVEGTTLPTVVGSSAAATLMNSSWREQNARMRLVSASSAQNASDWRIAQNCIVGANGYRAFMRFGVVFVPNSSHGFIGWINTTGAVASLHPPTSMQNMVGVGWSNNNYSSNLQLYWNAAGVATYMDLGSYFNVNTTAWYELEIAQQPNQARIDWWVRRLDISTIADVGSYLTSNIPANSLWLAPRWHGTPMVTSAVAIELYGATWYT